jgi:hypothetical protein
LSGYTGVDLTANALELAKANLQDLQNTGACSVQLIQSDILDYTQVHALSTVIMYMTRLLNVPSAYQFSFLPNGLPIVLGLAGMLMLM